MGKLRSAAPPFIPMVRVSPRSKPTKGDQLICDLANHLDHFALPQPVGESVRIEFPACGLFCPYCVVANACAFHKPLRQEVAWATEPGDGEVHRASTPSMSSDTTEELQDGRSHLQRPVASASRPIDPDRAPLESANLAFPQRLVDGKSHKSCNSGRRGMSCAERWLVDGLERDYVDEMD